MSNSSPHMNHWYPLQAELITALPQINACIIILFSIRYIHLQVEVSSPSAESENTLCTNSILGATMCTKITGTNPSTSNCDATTTTTTNICSSTKTLGKSSMLIVFCLCAILTLNMTSSFRARGTHLFLFGFVCFMSGDGFRNDSLVLALYTHIPNNMLIR